MGIYVVYGMSSAYVAYDWGYDTADSSTFPALSDLVKTLDRAIDKD